MFFSFQTGRSSKDRHAAATAAATTTATDGGRGHGRDEGAPSQLCLKDRIQDH